MAQPLELANISGVSSFFDLQGRGTVVTGHIEAGEVRVGDDTEIVGLARGGVPRKSVVTGVEMFHRCMTQAQAGDNVGLLLRGIKKGDVERGQVNFTCSCRICRQNLPPLLLVSLSKSHEGMATSLVCLRRHGMLLPASCQSCGDLAASCHWQSAAVPSERGLRGLSDSILADQCSATEGMGMHLCGCMLCAS